jgi:hypothetical protein
MAAESSCLERYIRSHVSHNAADIHQPSQRILTGTSLSLPAAYGRLGGEAKRSRIEPSTNHNGILVGSPEVVLPVGSEYDDPIFMNNAGVVVRNEADVIRSDRHQSPESMVVKPTD